MTTFVLVHGAWRGGWMWHRVGSLLEQAGHRAVAPTLPGLRLGDAAADASLEDGIEVVAEAIRAATADGPVVVVANDWGSLPAIAGVNRTGATVAAMVHWCGFIPDGAQSFFDIIPEADAAMLRERALAAPEPAVKVPWERWRHNFLHTASEEVAELTYGLLRPQPLTLMTTPLAEEDAAIPAVPTSYVVSALDSSLDLGDHWWAPRQSDRLGVVAVRLEVDYGLPLTAPELLANHLLTWAAG